MTASWADFGHRLRSEDGRYEAFGPSRPSGDVVVVASELRLATDGDGRPAFALTSLRGAHPFLPPEPHGRLDLGLEPLPLETIDLTEVHLRWPRSSVTAASANAAFVRVIANGPGLGDAELLRTPKTMRFNGLGHNRVSLRLGVEQAAILSWSLEDDALLVEAAAELVLPGWSATAEARASFDPAELIDHLHRTAAGPGLLSARDLRRALAVAETPIEWLGQERPTVASEAVDAMADRVVATWGTWVPAPATEAEPTVQLVAVDAVGSGRFVWDLAGTIPTSRVVVASFDPVGAARQLVDVAGLDTVVRSRTVAALPTGVLPVRVTSNLPPAPVGVERWGARLSAPPSLHRRQAIARTVFVRPDQPDEDVILRFSPAEAPIYHVEPFVVLRTLDGPVEIVGRRFAESGPEVELWPDVFPVDLVPLSISASLATMVDLEIRGQTAPDRSERRAGRRVDVRPDSAAEQPADLILDRDRLAGTLVLPEGSAFTTELEVTAIERRIPNADKRGPRRLRLPPRPVGPWALTPLSFPAFGPRSVVFTRRAASSTAPIHLEVRSVSVEGPTELIELDDETPSRTWRWFNSSIFEARFAYRLLGAEAWTSADAFETPVVEIRAIDIDDVPLFPSERRSGDLIHHRRRANPLTVAYLSARPSAVLDPRGRPMLRLLLAEDEARFHLSVTLQPPSAELERLRSALEEEDPEVGPVRLVPARVAVEAVALRVADQIGEADTVATVESSGGPDHTATLAVTVDEAGQDAIVAALSGAPGRVSVDYMVERAWTLTSSVTISGSVDLDDLPTGPVGDLVGWIEVALADGRLRLATVDNGATSTAEDVTAARREHRQRVIDEAAAVLASARGNSSPGTYRLELDIETNTTLARGHRLRTDLASWFTDGSGLDHISVVSTDSPF